MLVAVPYCLLIGRCVILTCHKIALDVVMYDIDAAGYKCAHGLSLPYWLCRGRQTRVICHSIPPNMPSPIEYLNGYVGLPEAYFSAKFYIWMLDIANFYTKKVECYVSSPARAIVLWGGIFFWVCLKQIPFFKYNILLYVSVCGLQLHILT